MSVFKPFYICPSFATTLYYIIIRHNMQHFGRKQKRGEVAMTNFRYYENEGKKGQFFNLLVRHMGIDEDSFSVLHCENMVHA